SPTTMRRSSSTLPHRPSRSMSAPRPRASSLVANFIGACRARSLEIDPRSVDARIGIALVLATNVGDGWSSSVEQDKSRAEQLLLKALERDANRSMAQYAMGMLRRVQNLLAESQIEFETAISLDRNN